MDLAIEKFSPTKAELTKLVEESKALDLPDPFDQAQLRKVKDARLNIRDARVAITKTGKALREDALKFQKAVIAKEKELVAIIEPEENRLAGLEDTAAIAVERKARVELLPHRRERLAAVGDGLEVSDDALLDMDGPAFEGYINKRLADKNEADRRALEAREAAIREEETRQQREKEMREREEKARQEERERLAREQKEKEERLEREKKEAEARAQREKEENEHKKREERERLEREERYQSFLKEHGYTEDTKDTFHIERSESEVRLYKLTGVLKIK
ncbi:MAG TPA: hypothetical protein VNJ52_05135 [Patescibacteria group bacterium]|nr:hypothetical protein [Patescibacteria group bacterium]